MEMFLMVAALSFVGVLVSIVLFAAATEDQRHERDSATLVTPLAPSQFFTDTATARQVPMDALLLQIERHVRLEQAAAESFVHAPTSESLHSRTTSTLVH